MQVYSELPSSKVSMFHGYVYVKLAGGIVHGVMTIVYCSDLMANGTMTYYDYSHWMLTIDGIMTVVNG